MKTTALFFPFDLFGSPGTGAGVELLADACREMLADNRRETAPTRARAYQDHVRLREIALATLDDYGDWRAKVRRAVRDARRRGDFLLYVSGNHLGVLPLYEELGTEEGSLVIQLDAHLDIHAFASCTPELSHGNFLLHADGPLPTVVNVGHRELQLTPEAIGRTFRATYSAAEWATAPEQVLARLREAAQAARRVVLDLDCDAFEPTSFTAVSTPMPFGLDLHAILRIVDAVWSDKVVGVALSEFAPARDERDRCLETLVWLVEYLLLRRYEGG